MLTELRFTRPLKGTGSEVLIIAKISASPLWSLASCISLNRVERDKFHAATPFEIESFAAIKCRSELDYLLVGCAEGGGVDIIFCLNASIDCGDSSYISG